VLKTVRVVFSKTGRARFISHLDLVRTMTRVVRRAEIPLWYTEGFNRHPYLTFAAPLSLGFEGLRESMDLRLEEDMPYDELVARLNAALPEGFEVLSAAEAVYKVGALTAARYRLRFDCPMEMLLSLLARPEILVEKRTKKKTMKTLDIRPAFADAVVTAIEGGAEVTVTLPVGNDTVNPSLLLQALNAESDREYHLRVLRLDLLTADGKSFR
jgi:radical SAM-linked protein